MAKVGRNRLCDAIPQPVYISGQKLAGLSNIKRNINHRYRYLINTNNYFDVFTHSRFSTTIT